MQKFTQAQKTLASIFLNITFLNIQKSYNNRVNIYGYFSLVYIILLISLFLSLFFVCVRSSLLQIHPTPPNHHSITTITTTHHNSSQPIVFQSQNQPKTKENQTFNRKLNNIEPKIKISTKNPLTQTQIEAAVVTTAMESLLLP